MSKNSEMFGHPKGLTLLFFTEMWERFSYYGMRAIFSLYMIQALMMNKKEASTIYGSYTGLVYRHFAPAYGALSATTLVQ